MSEATVTGAVVRAGGDPTALPAEAGAYVLVLALDGPAGLTVPRPHGCTLRPGVYAYTGSARGPGGLRARVGRHLRRVKRAHWHIDHILASARVLDLLVWRGGDECRWRAALTIQGAAAPVPGLGSSDCRRCPAHVLRLPDTGIVDAAMPELVPDP